MGNQLFGTIFFNDFLTGKGLGFNIRGGKDSPYIPGDPSIYVTRIDSDGMAAKDGRLSVGDKLIEVNRVVVDDRHINLTPLINKFVSSTIIASVAYGLRNSVSKRYDLPRRRQHNGFICYYYCLSCNFSSSCTHFVRRKAYSTLSNSLNSCCMENNLNQRNQSKHVKPDAKRGKALSIQSFHAQLNVWVFPRVSNNEIFENFIFPYKSKHHPMSIERKRISIWTRFLDDFVKHFKILFCGRPAPLIRRLASSR